jgi:RNA polymerase sigma-70 factor, ECF subfamily
MDTYEALVQQAQESGVEARSAFGELVERFREAAEGWAYDVLEDRTLAEDAAQEAFLTAYQHLDQLREPKAFPAWLKRIVLTQCSRLTRKKTLAMEWLDEDAAPVDDPTEEMDERELKARVLQAVNNLPEHERTVTELFYLTGYSQQEIARQLDVPLTTVKKRLQYARERLKESMPVMALGQASHSSSFDSALFSAAGFDSPELLFDWLNIIEALPVGYAESLQAEEI